MSEPERNARHGCSDQEIFAFFRAELENQYKFVFTANRPFIEVYNQETPCMATSNKTSKKLEQRAYYVIFQNYNNETGESWPCLKGVHISSEGEKQFYIHFADYYNREIKPRKGDGSYVPPPKKTEEQIQAEKIEQELRDKQIQIEKERTKRAAAVAIRLEWSRAAIEFKIPYTNKNTGEQKVFTKNINRLPYMVEKALPSYGARLLNPNDYTTSEAKAAVDKYYPDLIGSEKELLVEAVMLYQSKHINQEKENGKGYSLRSRQGLHIVPVMDKNNQLASLQHITHNRYQKYNKETGQKEETLNKGKYFFNETSSKENFLPISSNPNTGFEKLNPNAEVYIISEGWASGISTRMQLDKAIELNLIPFQKNNIQSIVAYSKANIAVVANILREINPNAYIFLSYDNDAAKALVSGHNPGLEEACNNFSLSGVLNEKNLDHAKTRITPPPVFKEHMSASDWDDIRLKLGIENGAKALARSINEAIQRSQNKVSELDYSIERYNRQREIFAKNYPDEAAEKDFQANYGLVIAQKDAYFKQDQQLKSSPKENKATVVNPKTVSKPVYKAPTFDNFLGTESVPSPNETKKQVKPTDTLDQKKSNDEPQATYQSFRQIAAQIDVNKEQNKVLKVVATQQGQDKIRSGNISFDTLIPQQKVEKPMPTPANDQARTVKIEALSQEDRNKVPQQDPKKGINHQTYEKNALFSAFWLHSCEVYKAQKIKDRVNNNQSSQSIEEKIIDEAKMDEDFDFISSMAISAINSETREILINKISELEAKDSNFLAIKKLKQNITEKTLAFDSFQINQQKVLEKIAALSVRKVITTGDNDPAWKSAEKTLNEALIASSNLNADRLTKLNIVKKAINCLTSIKENQQDSTVIDKLNLFFEKFEKRIEDLVKKDGMTLYGITIEQSSNYENSLGFER